MISWFYSLPLFVGGALFCLSYVAVSILIGVYIRKKFQFAELKANHEIAGFTFNVIGVIYAVLLGFVLINVWNDFARTQEMCEDEAARVIKVYRDVSMLPMADSDAVRSALRKYAEIVVKEEWKGLAFGKESGNAAVLLSEARQALHSAPVTTEKEKVFYVSAISNFSEAESLRGKRLLAARQYLHPFLYLALFVGGIMCTAFVFFLAHEKMVAQIVIIGSLSFIIALFIFMIMSIDNPFSGDFSVKPAAMEQTMGMMDSMRK